MFLERIHVAKIISKVLTFHKYDHRDHCLLHNNNNNNNNNNMIIIIVIIIIIIIIIIITLFHSQMLQKDVRTFIQRVLYKSLNKNKERH